MTYSWGLARTVYRADENDTNLVRGPSPTPEIGSDMLRMKSRLSIGIRDLLVHRFHGVRVLVNQRGRQNTIGALNLVHPREHLISAAGIERDDQLPVGRAPVNLRTGHEDHRVLDPLKARRRGMDDQIADMHFLWHWGFLMTGGVSDQLPGGPAKSWYIQTRKPQPDTMMTASTGAMDHGEKQKAFAAPVSS